MTSYIKPELLVLVPLLIETGSIIKQKFDGAKWVPIILLGEAIAIATIYGFIVTPCVGWHMVLDAVVITGVCHGAVAAFSAMGIHEGAQPSNISIAVDSGFGYENQISVSSGDEISIQTKFQPHQKTVRFQCPSSPASV